MYSKIIGQMINEENSSCFNDIEAINDARVKEYFTITEIKCNDNSKNLSNSQAPQDIYELTKKKPTKNECETSKKSIPNFRFLILLKV